MRLRTSSRSTTTAWYHPNNAVLVVAGGFDEKEALETIKKLFEPIPKGFSPRKPCRK